jgi:hypothetical protein
MAVDVGIVMLRRSAAAESVSPLQMLTPAGRSSGDGIPLRVAGPALHREVMAWDE